MARAIHRDTKRSVGWQETSLQSQMFGRSPTRYPEEIPRDARMRSKALLERALNAPTPLGQSFGDNHSPQLEHQDSPSVYIIPQQ